MHAIRYPSISLNFVFGHFHLIMEIIKLKLLNTTLQKCGYVESP